MKQSLSTKLFIALLIITLFSLFLSVQPIKAANVKQTDSNVKESSKNSDLESKTLEVEDKIMKYDAKTGKTTEVNMDEITKKASKSIKVESDNSLSIDSLEPLFTRDSIYSTPNYSTRSISRTQITDTSVQPYSAVCRIFFTDSGETQAGSGVLVCSNVVLTAAHCVFDENNEKFPSWEAQPGYNGSVLNGIASGWSEVYYSAAWTTTHSYEYDWAVCILNEDLGDNLGAFGLTYVAEENPYLENLPVITYRIS